MRIGAEIGKSRYNGGTMRNSERGHGEPNYQARSKHYDHDGKEEGCGYVCPQRWVECTLVPFIRRSAPLGAYYAL